MNADVSASAAIVDTKLDTIATASKVSGAALTLLANIPSGAGVIPSANLPGGGNLVVANPPEVTNANVQTEQTIFSVSIPANTLLTGKAIKFKAYFSAVSWGGNYNILFRMKYGATTVVSLATPSTNNGTGNEGWVEGYLLADGGSSAQKGAMGYTFNIDGKELAADAAVGFTKLAGHALGSAVENATGALTLTLSGQWEGDNVGNTYTAEFWVVEKIT